MHIQNRKIILVYRIILVLSCIWGLGSELGLPWHCAWDKFIFYTLLSNAACLLFFAAATIYTVRLIKHNGVKGDATPWPQLKGAVTMLITVTFLVFAFLLAPQLSQHPAYNFWSAGNICMHYVTPLLVIFDWLIFDKKNSYRWFSPLLWLAPPIAYLIFILIRAQTAGVISYTGTRYPYFFLDTDALGWPLVWLYIICIAAFFVVLGYVFWLADKISIGKDGIRFMLKDRDV